MNHSEAILHVLAYMPGKLMGLTADPLQIAMSFEAGQIVFALIEGKVKRDTLDAMIRKARG